MDETHGGFTAIYDGHALKFVLHNASNQQLLAACKFRFLYCDGPQGHQEFRIDGIGKCNGAVSDKGYVADS